MLIICPRVYSLENVLMLFSHVSQLTGVKKLLGQANALLGRFISKHKTIHDASVSLFFFLDITFALGNNEINFNHHQMIAVVVVEEWDRAE